METTQLDTMRAHIINMICQVTNKKTLNEIELLLQDNNISAKDDYSPEKLKDAVLRSREDILESRVVTIEELRRKHPRI